MLFTPKSLLPLQEAGTGKRVQEAGEIQEVQGGCAEGKHIFTIFNNKIN